MAHNILLAAEINHLLKFWHTADHGSTDRAAPIEESPGIDCIWLTWKSDDNEGSIKFQ